MTFENANAEKLLDSAGWAILNALQEDARLSYAELGRRVGLSAPAVMERIRKMEDAGIIKGYRVEVDPEKLGLPIRAIIRFANADRHEEHLSRMIEAIPNVIDCHHVLGSDAFVVQVVVPSVAHLDAICTAFQGISGTNTTVITTSPIENRPITLEMLDRIDIEEIRKS